MRSLISQALSATLGRVLETEPEITLEDARERVSQLVLASDLPSFNSTVLQQTLVDLSASYSRRGVINPHYLNQRGLLTHFFLLDAEPGWFDSLIHDSEQEVPGTSQYIIYGDWDSLLILNGTDLEAKQQLTEITRQMRDEPRFFTASETAVFYRHPTREPTTDADIDLDVVNSLARDYEKRDLRSHRDRLLQDNILLGPLWKSNSFPKNRVVAFTGIDVKGREDISAQELWNILSDLPTLSQSVVHLFKIRESRPFHFFSKLSCRSMDELDRATNEIELARLGPIRLEGSTMVVAAGRDSLPTIRTPTIRKVERRPQVDDLRFLAKDIISPFGEDLISQFNDLDSRRKLAALAGLNDLRGGPHTTDWPTEWQTKLDHAIETYARSVLDSSPSPALTGAVMEIAALVETALKQLVRNAVHEVYKGDFKRAQQEIRLSNKDPRRLSLGKCAQALGNIKEHPDFKRFAERLQSSEIEQVSSFASSRNKWAHGDPPGTTAIDRIEQASRFIVRGMELLKWLCEEFNITTKNTQKKIALPPPSEEREIGVFISYSSKDRAMAERIATALRAVSLDVWFDSWEIQPGDGILQKIEDGLTQNDIILILLSPHAVDSTWVRKELDTALMRQLSGQHVTIIPIVIEDCEIPATLKDIENVKFTGDFQRSFIDLMQALSKLRKRVLQDVDLP